MDVLIQSFLIGFSAASFPGAIQAIVFQTAILGKIKESFKYAAGVEVMDIVIIFLSYFGLAQITKFPWVFYLIGLLGVVYILFLGVSGLINSIKKETNLSQTSISGLGFIKGALMCVLSPYTYLFFLGYVSTILINKNLTVFGVGSNAVSLAFGAFISYALVSILGLAINKQNNQKIIHYLHFATAILMIFFALKMAVNLFVYGN